MACFVDIDCCAAHRASASCSGYLADQATIRNLYALLEDGSGFEKVDTVPMLGETGSDEKQLIVYRRVRSAVAIR